MNYKRVISSRKLRVKILYLLSFIPDRIMISIQYRIKTGRRLNVKNPKRYTEKLQWYKMNCHNPLMSKCVDKYTVRNYVKKCGLESILVPLIGVYQNVEDIDFNALPSKFVMKDTLGGGGTAVYLCSDKSEMNETKVKEMLHSWVDSKKGKHPGREWVYDNRRSRILVENYIDSNFDKGGLIDYKFFCFNGKVAYIYGIADRKIGEGAGLGIYDKDFNLLPYLRADERPLKREIKKPDNFEDMVRVAEKLAKPFIHARIDLYSINGKVFFGEITFFDGSGYMKFEPDEFDFMMGDLFKIEQYEKKRYKKSIY